MSDEFIKVRVDLSPDDDGFPPAGAETLWTSPTHDPEVFRVDSIPVFVEDLAIGDEIHILHEGDELVFDGLFRASQHSTIWVIVEDAYLSDDVWRRELRESLRTLGCESEWDDVHGIIAVDVPPESHIDEVESRLRQEEARGTADYAHGCLRH
jgi:uncharacterized protein DUF4265